MTRPATPLSGIHHVTAIAGDPHTNVTFYREVLGQRLVKKTVNFDDPHTYHLYYGDALGSPGSIMTFFPWPRARRGTSGAGQATLTSYAVPSGSIAFWVDRLRAHGVRLSEPNERFGETALQLLDPDGLRIELVEVEGVGDIGAWSGSAHSPIPEAHAIRGFRGVTLGGIEDTGSQRFLTEVMGFRQVATEGSATRFAITDGSTATLANTLDLEFGSQPGRGGAGTVHHVAFRIADDQSELAWQSHLSHEGHSVSPVMDRNYFHSIYFREPGGVLFEIATDPPGFAVDEPVEKLGEELMLPPALEAKREQIEEALPRLDS